MNHEILKGPPTGLKKMPLTEVAKLQAGDLVYVWWAKDGNLKDVRLNEIVEICEREENERKINLELEDSEGELSDFDLYHEDLARSGDCNCAEWAGRGLAHFFRVPGINAAEIRRRRDWIAETKETLAKGELEPRVAQEMEEAIREPEWLFALFAEKSQLARVDDLSPEQRKRLGEINAQIDAWEAK